MKERPQNVKLGSTNFQAPDPSAANTRNPGIPLKITITSNYINILGIDLPNAAAVPPATAYCGTYDISTAADPTSMYATFYDANGNYLGDTYYRIPWWLLTKFTSPKE